MEKTRRIYHGKVMKLVVGVVEVKPSATEILKASKFVVREDALFYRNMFGKMVNFEFNTVLPTYDEAFDYIQIQKTRNSSCGSASCLYSDLNDMIPEDVSVEHFKQLKKEYKVNKR